MGEDILESLTRVISHLEGNREVSHGVTKGEVADRIAEARRFEESPDRTVALYVGRSAPEMGVVGDPLQGLATDNMCTCFSVTKARVLWDDAADALPAASPAAAHAPAEITWSDMPFPTPLRKMLKAASSKAKTGDGADILREQRRLLDSEEKELDEEGDLLVDDNAEFEQVVDNFAKKYAQNHRTMTMWFLSFPSVGVSSEPLCDSGPLFPPYTVRSSGCHFVPSSNTYGAGFSFPAGSLGVGYFNSCPYGFFTSCPHCLGYSGGFNPCGRQWPERRLCCCHPCRCSNSDDFENNEFWEAWEKKEKGRRLAGSSENEELYHHAGHELLPSKTADRIFFAPDGRVYDARLVEALFAFAEQGVQVKTVTLFSTRLEQLKYLGWNPPGSFFQHMGVTVELSRPVQYEHLTVQFLTLEMMAPGLMWTVGANQAPTEHYDYQKQRTFVYHDLSPSVIARYLTGSRHRKYAWGTTDCQTFAMELMQRLVMHGRRLRANSGSVHVDVMHPKSVTGWEAQLTQHIKALLNRDTKGIMEVKIGADEHECPANAGAMRAMSKQANHLWTRCTEPLGLSHVEIRVSDDILGAVQQTLDILSDDEAFGEDSFMFLSVPQLNPDLEQGPLSYAEWKTQNKVQFDAHFLLIVIFIVMALLVAIWFLIKLVAHISGTEVSARSPWRKTVMPVTFAASLLSGTVVPPLAVGLLWCFQKKDSDESGEASQTGEMELTGDATAAD